MKIRKIYVMWAPGLPYVFKVGISSSPRHRAAQITDELDINCSIVTSKVLVVASVPSPFSERHEAFLHRLFAPFRARMRPHSGHTEWFFSFFPNLALGAVLFVAMKAHGLDMKSYLVPALAVLPFPIGPVVALLLLFVIEVIFILITIIVIVSFIYLIIHEL